MRIRKRETIKIRKKTTKKKKKRQKKEKNIQNASKKKEHKNYTKKLTAYIFTIYKYL